MLQKSLMPKVTSHYSGAVPRAMMHCWDVTSEAFAELRLRIRMKMTRPQNGTVRRRSSNYMQSLSYVL